MWNYHKSSDCLFPFKFLSEQTYKFRRASNNYFPHCIWMTLNTGKIWTMLVHAGFIYKTFFFFHVFILLTIFFIQMQFKDIVTPNSVYWRTLNQWYTIYFHNLKLPCKDLLFKKGLIWFTALKFDYRNITPTGRRKLHLDCWIKSLYCSHLHAAPLGIYVLVKCSLMQTDDLSFASHRNIMVIKSGTFQCFKITFQKK